MGQPNFEVPMIQGMDSEDRILARERIAMKDKKKLKQFLEASGRRYLILDSWELLDAFPDWAWGSELLMQMISCLRAHRATIPTGRKETITDPRTKKQHDVDVMKGEALELEEVEGAIQQLINRGLEIDPNWKFQTS